MAEVFSMNGHGRFYFSQISAKRLNQLENNVVSQ
jgi:hypothetical protein